ncbi:MAG: hypothetical protein JW814_03480 [Candidatus Krumholzibacteriota bacterium]|nr:hypothetical protein [Candidatus Krumholzibacteriota bacterium]
MVDHDFHLVEDLSAEQIDVMLGLFKKARCETGGCCDDGDCRGAFDKIIAMTDLFAILTGKEGEMILFARIVRAFDDSLHIVDVVDGGEEPSIIRLRSLLQMIIDHERFREIELFKYYCPLRLLPRLNFSGIRFTIDESFENISVVKIARD